MTLPFTNTAKALNNPVPDAGGPFYLNEKASEVTRYKCRRCNRDSWPLVTY